MRDADDPNDGPEEFDAPGAPEELSAGADIHKNAWSQTIDDMQALGSELRDEGWETVITSLAVDTAPEPPEDGPEGRWGLVHVVPDNNAEPIQEAVAAGEFPKFDVFRATAEGRIFLVTQLLDPETKTAVLVAGNFQRRLARGAVRTAMEHDEFYTHLQTLDGTHLGSFRHESYEKFFPEADRLVDVDPEV
ncbi:DUF7529 family protein [Halostella salina]|uniref:DUF7529 family protein n=1 Tax=Halostella salina TaxID=1547897 RepID=UPI000EF7B375|nr:hypothetical protein [Halostella salina]